ncbi:polysaccharide biosynthesis/export family protein [Sphingomonas sp. BIUV-7]|uniref:Polysaccharide biosynthesis/export family protein n=1 Tax=Sphingomonas natans TaxID=3063330 RepID=A0ABT8YEN7_9SPHN|nr:polysaccharide biosynthesis/export family protein [Sphingomonas sp. BIUV-7]MDO6416800.1 polysaccharide biosynthesis/export family protein [Sphingomonas sp. BIUV-7]
MMIRPVAALLGLAALLPASLFAQGAPPTAASAPTPVPAAKLPGQAASTYRISAGDMLDVYVWGDERLQRALTVLPDGTFGFPLAGTVMAATHTTNEVESELSRLLAPQYKGVAPQVTVSVKQSSGMQISVIGKVRSPGTFSPTRYVTVLDALALAGGPSEFADLGNVVILRNNGGKSSVVRAKLAGVLKGRPTDGDLAGDGIPLLLAGDTVVVP